MIKLISFFKKIIVSKKGLGSIITIFVLIYVFFALWNSSIPKFPNPGEIIHDGTHQSNQPLRFTKSLKGLLQDELDHGWLPNDFFLSPTKLLLDNRPNFQIGVLSIVRHSARVLRDNLSRQRTTDEINPDIDKAFSLLSNDYEQWIFPSYEGKIAEAINHFDVFIKDFEQNRPSVNIFVRSDNLIQLFDQYISELGNLNTKLLSGDTSFFSNDDLFYLVKGTTYALYVVLNAVGRDFETVIAEKKGQALFQETINRIKQSDFDPIMVASGDNESLLANHLIQMAGITADVRQKLKSLNVMLDKN